MSFKAILTTAIASLLAAGSAAADTGDVFFVDVRNTSGTQDGLAWATAFDTIQEGIEAAREDFGGEVWVARGTYSERRANASGSLLLRPGVDVYGGFRGTEIRRSQRNPKVYPTVIDGSTSAGGNPAATVVDGANNTVLDGFTVQGGRGEAGAGVLNLAESPIIRNCTFRDNIAESFGGAAFNIDGAAPTLIACVFADNSATGSGGAVTNTASAATFTDCVFSGNHSEAAGGAMFNTPDSPVLIEGCTFESNTAVVGGGAIFNQGAAPAIDSSFFIANSTDGFGGAIFNNQAGDTLDSADTLITNSVLARNDAASGGGAFATLLSALTVVNCTIVDNTAPEEFGGAFFNNAAETEVINSIIWYNSDEWIVNLADSFTQIRWSNVGGGDRGPNNIAIEPRFVDREDDDYRLLPDSPSIDAGTEEGAPAADLLGTPRPLFDGIDQGAYEAQDKADAQGPQCHGDGDEAPESAMPDPASAMLIGLLAVASWRRKRN